MGCECSEPKTEEECRDNVLSNQRDTNRDQGRQDRNPSWNHPYRIRRHDRAIDQQLDLHRSNGRNNDIGNPEASILFHISN